ncbi:MAG: cellulase family glycosylhydrolase [Lentisphaeria bacterium]|nr:cellulase family glycosylhydrolase [Lentisphaeria bacterium]
MSLRAFILTGFAVCAFLCVSAVPYESGVRFDGELSPQHFQILAGAKSIQVENGRLVLRNRTEPAVFNYKFYPLRKSSSRPPFGNFTARLKIDSSKLHTPFRWGMNRGLADALEIEVDPRGRTARLLYVREGRQREAGPRIALPPAGEDGDVYELQRVNRRIVFSAGQDKQQTVIGTWEGELPGIVDFSFKLPGTHPENEAAILEWQFRPLPRFEGCSEVCRNPGMAIPFEGDEKHRDVGGNFGEGFLWKRGGKAEMKIRVVNPGREARNFVLRTEITDIDDAGIAARAYPLELEGGGERVVTIPLPSGRTGYFNFRHRLCAADGTPLEALTATGFGITAAGTPAELSGRAVIGIHGQPFALHGAKHVRFWDNGGRGMFWSGIEPKKGAWDFSRIDAYVNKTLAANMTPLVVLAATPEWASTQPERGTYIGRGAYAPPKNIDDWSEYCRRLAERFKGKVRHYEIWNEPNNNGLAPRGFFFHSDVNDYYKLAEAAYAAIKSVDPEAKILAPSGTGSFFAFLDKFLELGGGECFDILSVHTYCTPLPPEIGYYFNSEKSYQYRIEHAREIMRRHGVEKPVWNTEVGYHDGLNMRVSGELVTADAIAAEGLPEAWPNWFRGWPFRPLDARRGAAFFVRFGLQSMVLGVERVYIHHRLLDAGREPYTAAPAVGFLNTFFDGAAFRRRLPSPEALHLYEFRLADGKRCIAAYQVYPETLMMNRSAELDLKNVDTAPVAGIAEQKSLSQAALREIVSRPNYFEPGSRRYFRLVPSRKPVAVYDMWGNRVPESELGKVTENPVYCVFDGTEGELAVTSEPGTVIPERVPVKEVFSGSLVKAEKPAAVPASPEALLPRTVNVNLGKAELVDGAKWDRKGWLELHTGQGVSFLPDGRFPKRGRLLCLVRSGNSLNGFGFRYGMRVGNREVELRPWSLWPLREIMRGRGWILAVGYLISEPVDFSQGTPVTLHAFQGNSHVLRVAVLEQ